VADRGLAHGADKEKVLIEVRLSRRSVQEYIPMLLHALGTTSIAKICFNMLSLDGTPIYDALRWRWDADRHAYVYSRDIQRGTMRYLLAWDSDAGWLFRPDDPETHLWAPLYSPEDHRNRPDQFHLAMCRMVFLHIDPDQEACYKRFRDATRGRT
jgi:hypothetical protein